MELTLAREMGENGANYMAVEYGGAALADLSMDARFTVANMSVDMGAKTGIMEVDEKALDWARAHGAPVDGAVAPDEDAVYARRIHLDISGLTPVVAAPPATGNAHPVEDYAGLPVQQAFVGTCTNGRFEDIEIAAQIVRGRKIAPGVRFYVAPTSKKIYEAAAASGAIGALAEAGAARAHRRLRAVRLDDGERLSGRRGARHIFREPQFPGQARQQGGRDISGLPGHGGGERGDGPHHRPQGISLGETSMDT